MSTTAEDHPNATEATETPTLQNAENANNAEEGNAADESNGPNPNSGVEIAEENSNSQHAEEEVTQQSEQPTEENTQLQSESNTDNNNNNDNSVTLGDIELVEEATANDNAETTTEPEADIVAQQANPEAVATVETNTAPQPVAEEPVAVADTTTTTTTATTANAVEGNTAGDRPGGTTDNEPETTATDTATTDQHHDNGIITSPSGSAVDISDAPPQPPKQYLVNRFGEIITNSPNEREVRKEKKKLDKEKERVDKWVYMMNKWARWRVKHPSKIKERVRKGIPNQVRGRAWQLLADSITLKQQNPGLYETLKQKSSTQSVEGEDVLRRDLHRTFPQLMLFKEHDGDGQKRLFCVLKAFAMHCPEPGYCQGMAFVAGMLLSYMEEDEAFWMMVRMMDEYNFKKLYSRGFPYLRQCLYVFERLLIDRLPKLHEHFTKEGFITMMYADKWFMTLYAYYLPMEHTLRIWDMFLYEKWKIIYRIAIATLKYNEAELLKMSIDKLMEFVQKRFVEGVDADKLIDKALDYPLAHSDLDRYEKEYFAIAKAKKEEAAANTATSDATTSAETSAAR